MSTLSPSQIALLSTLTTQIRTNIVSSGATLQSVQVAKSNVASSVNTAIINSDLLDTRPQPDITDVIKILILNVNSNQNKLVQNINSNLDNITKSQLDEFLPIKGQLLSDKIPYPNNVLTNDIDELLKNLSDKISALSVNTLEYEKLLASLISSTDRSGLVVGGGLDGIGLVTTAPGGLGGAPGASVGTGTGGCTLGTPGCIAGDSAYLNGPITGIPGDTATGAPGPTGCGCGCGGCGATPDWVRGGDSAYLNGAGTVVTGATNTGAPAKDAESEISKDWIAGTCTVTPTESCKDLGDK